MPFLRYPDANWQEPDFVMCLCNAAGPVSAVFKLLHGNIQERALNCYQKKKKTLTVSRRSSINHFNAANSSWPTY